MEPIWDAAFVGFSVIASSEFSVVATLRGLSTRLDSLSIFGSGDSGSVLVIIGYHVWVTMK